MFKEEWLLKGLPSLCLFIWLLRDVCYTDKVSVHQFVRQWWGQLMHLQQIFTHSAGKNGLFGVLENLYQTMLFLPLN